MRLAPSLEIIRPLQQEGACIRAYDPKAMEKAKELLPGVEFCSDAFAAAKDADALIICTEWDEFRQLDLDKLRATMAQPIVLDGRNIFDPVKMKQLGFTYQSVGR
jgi:UDPglucose 6-dehydrogenase